MHAVQGYLQFLTPGSNALLDASVWFSADDSFRKRLHLHRIQVLLMVLLF